MGETPIAGDGVTWLYRIYDGSDRLLYVGISLSVAERLGSHRRGKAWWPEVSRIDVEHFGRRREALIAESEAIRRERPMYNIAGCSSGASAARLADNLRALRLRAAMQAGHLAGAVGWQPSKVSRIELGRMVPSPEDVRAWAAACSASDEEASTLIDIRADELAERRAMTLPMQGSALLVHRDIARIAAEASVVRCFEITCIPSFMQTEPYARKIAAEISEFRGLPLDDVTASRSDRRDSIFDSTKNFEFLIVESALHFRSVSAQVMHGQLDWLMVLNSARNIRFGVIPTRRLSITPRNSFQIFDDTVVVESAVDEKVLHDQADHHRRILDLLWADAVEGHEARALVLNACRALVA